jgi:RHS repeat-associated protein
MDSGPRSHWRMLQGALQNQYTFELFGATSTSGASSTNALEFTGRENDATGLYFYRARYYSPGTARFLSEDPLQFPRVAANGDNLYAYVRNSPTGYIDPTGESTIPIPRVQLLRRTLEVIRESNREKLPQDKLIQVLSPICLQDFGKKQRNRGNVGVERIAWQRYLSQAFNTKSPAPSAVYKITLRRVRIPASPPKTPRHFHHLSKIALPFHFGDCKP